MRAIRRLKGDEDGTILVFVALALVVLLGMVALSFDLGRMASTQTELQSFADNVALAAAGELDGRADSIDRAESAAEEMIADTQTFGGNEADDDGITLDIEDVTLVFLSELDADDALPYDDTIIPGPGYDADEQRSARYVRVDIDPHAVPLTFASAFASLSGNAEMDNDVDATAVAGFTQIACDIAPLFICMPDEGVQPHQMVRLVAGSGGFWDSGNFGFLDISETSVDQGGPCAGLKEAQLTRCLLGATERITACYSLNGVGTDPGRGVGTTVKPINFRFDMFSPSDKDQRTDPLFAPAPNTVRGHDPGQKGNPSSPTLDYCTPVVPAANSIGLPRGAEFADDNLRFGNVDSFGDTSAARLEYVNRNYNGTDPFAGQGITTRWEYYQAEITRIATLGRILPPTTASGATRLETGVAQCSPNRSTDPERRVIVVAVIDCDSEDINGKRTVQAEEFWRVFLTEPVADEGGVDKDIFGETIDNVGVNTDSSAGIFHDFVQLYR